MNDPAKSAQTPGDATATTVAAPRTDAQKPAVPPVSFVGRSIDDPVGAIARAHPATAIRVEVAQALLASAGVANVVLGSCSPQPRGVAQLRRSQSGPLILPLAIVARDLQESYYRAGRRAFVTGGIWWYGLLLALFVTPVGLLLFTAGLYVLGMVWRRYRARRVASAQKQREDLAAYVLTLGVLPFLPLIFFVSTPWLPPENLVIDGSTTLGYVTAVDSRWTEVLLSDPRRVAVYKSESITERTRCTFGRSPLVITLFEIPKILRSVPDELLECSTLRAP
jgi:hypothetical protein